MDDLDYETLNPGIREVVRLLRGAGFNTTDSGDGITNVAGGMEGAIPFPHVHCVVRPAVLCNIKDIAMHMVNVLRAEGVEIGIGYVQLTYDPLFPEATTLSLLYISDAVLADARARAAK